MLSGNLIDHVTLCFLITFIDKCPDDYGLCTRVFSSVTLKHLDTITNGELTMAFRELSDEIASPVEVSSGVPSTYIGDPVVSADLAFFLQGVKVDSGLNDIQKRYFERIATEFFSAYPDPPTFATEVIRVDQLTNSRRSLGHSLRGTRRLESTAKVVATIVAAVVQQQ